MRSCVVALSLATTGCVGWYSGDANAPDSLGTHAPRTVAIAVEGELGDPMFANQDAPAIARAELTSALAEAGFTVVADRAQAERVVTMHVDRVSYFEPGIFGIFAICTLFVIPAIYGDRYEVRATMTDQGGAPLAQRTLREGSTKVIELLFLPAEPFLLPTTVDARMWRAVARDLAGWASVAR